MNHLRSSGSLDSRTAARLFRPLPLALLAAILILAWQATIVAGVYDGKWTGLYCIDNLPLPPEASQNLYVWQGTHGYDAQMYRIVAFDPFFQKRYASFAHIFDVARYRYRRILVPLAAYLLACGRPESIDAAYIGVMLAFLALGVYWSARFMELNGSSAAWGLLFLLTPGALTSIDRMLLDGPLTALFAGFLVYTRTGERWKLFCVIAAACLTKETGAILLFATVGAALSGKHFRRALFYCAAGAPAAAWFLFVQLQTHRDVTARLLRTPIVSIILQLIHLPARRYAGLIGFAFHVSDAAALIGLLGCIFLGFMCVAKRLPPFEIPIALAFFALLAATLAPAGHLVDAYGYGRPISPLLLYLSLAGAIHRRWFTLAAPLLVSQAILIYPLAEAMRAVRHWAG